MATPEHNQIADSRLATLPRRHFLTSLGAAAAAVAVPPALASPAAALTPPWPAPHDVAGHTALIERGLELLKLEDAKEGDTDPWGDSPVEIFTVNAIYEALQDSVGYRREHDFFRSEDLIGPPSRSFLPGELLAQDDAVRSLCANMFRAGQLVTAAMMAR